jgi:hypothetical protein
VSVFRGRGFGNGTIGVEESSDPEGGLWTASSDTAEFSSGWDGRGDRCRTLEPLRFDFIVP